MTLLTMGVREAVSNAAWGQWTQADYSPEQWRRACLVDMGEGDPNVKGRFKVPVREPDGTLNRNGCHAAAGAHGMQGVDAPPDAKRSAARALVRLYRTQLKEDPPEAILSMAGMSETNSRHPYGNPRGVQVVNIEIESGADAGEGGDGAETECECEIDSGTCCSDCGCCCGGQGEGDCGCVCGAEGTCATCGCSCDDPTVDAGAGDQEMNACGPGKKRRPGGGMSACAPGKKRRPRSAGRHLITREVAFRIADTSGDGRTLTGYAAVFDSPTRIDSVFEGTFDEQIRRGAFKRYLAERTPTLMFEHGHHPLIGSMPLGKITRATEDAKGLYIEARLSDNWLIEPVRDAVRDGAITGMSFRFIVPEGGDIVERRKGDVPLRTLVDVDVPELGPVVFPAYEPTTVSVRSTLDRLSQSSLGHSTARSGEGGGRTVGPRNEAAALSYQQLVLTRMWANQERGN